MTARNDQVRLKASQNLISLVENMGTGENLPVGKQEAQDGPISLT